MHLFYHLSLFVIENIDKDFALLWENVLFGFVMEVHLQKNKL